MSNEGKAIKRALKASVSDGYDMMEVDRIQGEARGGAIELIAGLQMMARAAAMSARAPEPAMAPPPPIDSAAFRARMSAMMDAQTRHLKASRRSRAVSTG